MRAITSEYWDDKIEEKDAIQTDSNGSAKVALIGIDRSIGAWGEMRNYLPDKDDRILTILLHLDRLRRKVEQFFPEAREFVRPGFDELR